MVIDQFIASYKTTFFPRLTVEGEASLRTLASSIDGDATLAMVQEKAYVLATVRREAGPLYKIQTEEGPVAYFSRYWPSTTLGRQLGNLEPADAYLYRGRGYVQITGRYLYNKFAELLGIDLIADPDLALVPATAYVILSKGMKGGLFTGKGLTDYIKPGTPPIVDYVDARRIINGTDRAATIAADARKFQTLIEQSTPKEQQA